MRLASALALMLILAVSVAAPGTSEAPTGDAKPIRFVAFVALEDADQVAIVSGPPWHVTRKVAVSAGPHNVVASSDGEFVAVTSPSAEAVTLFRARTGTLVRTIRVDGYPHDAVFGAKSRTLWVTAERAGRLVEIAVPDGRVLRRVRTSGAPHDLDLDLRRGELWVTIDRSSSVLLVVVACFVPARVPRLDDQGAVREPSKELPARHPSRWKI